MDLLVGFILSWTVVLSICFASAKWVDVDMIRSGTRDADGATLLIVLAFYIPVVGLPLYIFLKSKERLRGAGKAVLAQAMAALESRATEREFQGGRVCRACQIVNPEANKFCRECGSPMLSGRSLH